jgi:murein lipoprotein
MSVKTLSKISMLVLAAGLTVGCASTSDLKAVQQEATEAKSMARNAMDTANEAKSIAMDAKSVSMATEEKINRMFKKSMYK